MPASNEPIAREPRVLLELRRLLTGLSWVVFGTGALLLTLLWFPYLNFFEHNKERRIKRARASISCSFRLFLRMLVVLGVTRIELEDIQQLRTVKGAIIVANHPTILDYVLIASQLPELDCLVKAELKQNFFLKGVVAAADYLLNDHGEAILQDCEARLARGDSILIFPEGTRTVPGEPLKLKRGVAHIALRLNAPIEVLAINAPPRWLSKHAKWYEIPRRGSTLRVHRVGRVLPSDFVDESEQTHSLSSRRLTRHLSDILTKELKNN